MEIVALLILGMILVVLLVGFGMLRKQHAERGEQLEEQHAELIEELRLLHGVEAPMEAPLKAPAPVTRPQTARGVGVMKPLTEFVLFIIIAIIIAYYVFGGMLDHYGEIYRKSAQEEAARELMLRSRETILVTPRTKIEALDPSDPRRSR